MIFPFAQPQNAVPIYAQPNSSSSPQIIALENAIDDVATDRCASTENRRVTELFTKLLPALLHLAGWFVRIGGRGDAAGAVRDIKRQVAVTGRLRRLHGLGVVDADVAAWEYALGAGPLVAAFPPLRVHVLGHGDAVVGLQVQVAGVGGCVGVQGDSVGERGGLRWSIVGWRRVVLSGREAVAVGGLLVRVAVGGASGLRGAVQTEAADGGCRGGCPRGSRCVCRKIGQDGRELLLCDDVCIGKEFELLSLWCQ